MSDGVVVNVVGGGLAGSECALQLAARGMKVRLFEQRPAHASAAHHGSDFAELVCSNSLKSLREDSAAGLLKHELLAMGSKLLAIALECSVPAGGALAVDRERFSGAVTAAVEKDPNIEIVRERVDQIPPEPCVIAAGPLCSDGLFEDILSHVGGERGSFYDAAAPIVDAASLDMDIVFSQSRYEEQGLGDYLNCPFERDEYEVFWHELVSAKRVVSKEFEQTDLFCACQPAEEVARTGVDSLRFGAMKPVGLTDPRSGRRPWAAVQLRAENSDHAAYNIVGFQTNLTWPEQRRVFRMIPGLENAEFFRYGVMHRNSFIDSPRALDETFALPVNGRNRLALPRTSAFGSLVAYATDPNTNPYQPMHVNFGIFPPLEPPVRKKRERFAAYSARSRKELLEYISARSDLFGDVTPSWGVSE